MTLKQLCYRHMLHKMHPFCVSNGRRLFSAVYFCSINFFKDRKHYMCPRWNVNQNMKNFDPKWNMYFQSKKEQNCRMNHHIFHSIYFGGFHRLKNCTCASKEYSFHRLNDHRTFHACTVPPFPTPKQEQ